MGEFGEQTGKDRPAAGVKLLNTGQCLFGCGQLIRQSLTKGGRGEQPVNPMCSHFIEDLRPTDFVHPFANLLRDHHGDTARQTGEDKDRQCIQLDLTSVCGDVFTENFVLCQQKAMRPPNRLWRTGGATGKGD